MASLEICIWSGNEYWFILILLYVYLISFVSNGGLPINKVYIITPIDQVSAGYECPIVSRISGAM